MRWSCGADGLDPRLAQRRVILFFWPSAPRPWNQISIALPLAGPTAISATAEVFKCLGRISILRMMPRASREFAVAHRAHFAAQGLLTETRNSSHSHWARSHRRQRTTPST